MHRTRRLDKLSAPDSPYRKGKGGSGQGRDACWTLLTRFAAIRAYFLRKGLLFTLRHGSRMGPVYGRPEYTPSRNRFFSICQFVFLCSVVTGHVGPSEAVAQTTAPHPADLPAAVVALENTIVSAISRAEKSVVAITRTPPEGSIAILEDSAPDAPFRQLQRSSGQLPLPDALGVILDRNGLILTLSDLVNKTDLFTVTTTAGLRLAATVKASDPRSGLAILEVSFTDLSPIAMGNAEQLRKGALVIAIGNPHALVRDGKPSASWGIVSNLAQRIGPGIQLGSPDKPTTANQSLHQLGTLIQTDAKLAFSTGGGALINLRGEFIGLTTSAATIAGHERPAGYAIPMNGAFRRIIDTLKEGREVEYGLLGVGLGSPIETSADRQGSAIAEAALPATGVSIESVMPGSPAALAGLKIGDQITHIDDHPIENGLQLQLLVGTLRPATVTQVRYRRAGQMSQASIALAKYPFEGHAIVTTQAPVWRGIRVDYSTTGALAKKHPAAIVSKPDPAGCVVIREVLSDSPSWKAGLRPGMYISHVDHQRVTSPKAFHRAINTADGLVQIELTEPLSGKAEPEPNQPQPAPSPSAASSVEL